MGIEFKCKKCSCKVKFPDTPNYETDRYERIAHAIYSAWANCGVCGNCK
jgi:hypothetical protein